MKRLWDAYGLYLAESWSILVRLVVILLVLAVIMAAFPGSPFLAVPVAVSVLAGLAVILRHVDRHVDRRLERTEPASDEDDPVKELGEIARRQAARPRAVS